MPFDLKQASHIPLASVLCRHVCVSVEWLGRQFAVLPFHVQQRVCVSQLRAPLSLIRPYLPVRQHNKRIFKEDISLLHCAQSLYWYHLECTSKSSPLLEIRFCEKCFGNNMLRECEHCCHSEAFPWHQTPTKGCLHLLTLDKCLVWLYAQLYQFSDRSPSLSISLSAALASSGPDLMTHRNASSRLSEINHLRQVFLPIVWGAGH